MLPMLDTIFSGTRAGGPPPSRFKVLCRVSSQCPDGEGLLSSIAQQRDREAFTRLFIWFAPRIKAQLLAAGATNAVADELAQEVMLLAWRKAGQFDPARGAARTWLYTMTRRVWLNHRRGRAPSALGPDDGGNTLAAGVDPEAAVAGAEWGAALGAALASLPEEQREALRGAYFADHSLREVAAETCVPLGTIKTRVRLALDRLRGILGAGWNR